MLLLVVSRSKVEEKFCEVNVGKHKIRVEHHNEISVEHEVSASSPTSVLQHHHHVIMGDYGQ